MEIAVSDARDDAAGRIAALHAAVDALGAAGCSAGLADGCAAGLAGGGAAAPCGLADDTLVAVAVAGERLLRCVEGLVVEVAGEVAARSARELGDDRLTVKHGCADAVSLLANLTGVSKRNAATRIKLGTLVRASTSSLGVAGPSRFPEVLAALREGRVGTDAARNITRMLTDSARRVGYSADLAECERMLVIAADQNTTPTTNPDATTATDTDFTTTDPDATSDATDTAMATVCGLGLSADQIAVMAAQWQGHLDPDGPEPTARDLEAKRGLWLRQLDDGMVKLGGLLTPEQGATWQAIAQTILSPRLPHFTTPTPDATEATEATEATDSLGAATSESWPLFTDDDGVAEVGTVLADPRNHDQLLADGFTTYIRRIAGLPDVPELCGARPTINVHATLTDVVTGVGVGWIDGLTHPVPESTVDQLICHGDIITTLMHEGRILQHGKTKRLFTAAQNRALAARDGGCIWPGCNRPPSWCETHHVNDWRHNGHLPGRTDTDNGVLLCHFHHSHVHKSRWKLVMRNGAPHIIPPPEIDWTQTPRPCTQQRTHIRR